MAKPKPRELDAVAKICVLTEHEVGVLYTVLRALGFDADTMALFWNKTEPEVRSLFRVDVPIGSQHNGLSLTGADLAWWCELVWLRPGVVQQRLNFDETNLRLRKQGRSSSRVPMSWVGPPLFATRGALVEGRAYCELLKLVKVPEGSSLSAPFLAQVAEGKYPLRLPQIRDIMKAIEEAGISHPKVAVMEAALRSFPAEARTPEEVLEALTAKDNMVVEGSEITKQQEDLMQVRITDRFAQEFSRRKLGSIVWELMEKDAALRTVMREQKFELERPFPGPFEEVIGSGVFTEASSRYPELTSPLEELGRWLKKERQKENEKTKTSVRVTPQPKVTSPRPVTSVRGEPKSIWSDLEVLVKPQTSPPRVSPPVSVGSRPKPTVAPQPKPSEVPVPSSKPSLPSVLTDGFGMTWDWEKGQLTLGLMQVPLVKSTFDKTVSRRLYQSLSTLREALGEDWQVFCKTLGVDPHWVSNLVLEEPGRDMPRQIETIIMGFHKSYQLRLIPEQLLGLASLPIIASENEYLFALGDTKAAYRFVSLLTKYRGVKKWFCDHYGLTDEHLRRLERAEICVPLPVHLALMYKVQKRLEGSEGAIPPRAYLWFLDQPACQPVKDKTFALDDTNIPDQHWLKAK